MARFTQRVAEARPDAIAVSDERGATDWREFDRRVNRLIHALRKAGVQAGDTIAVFAANRRENYEVMVAAGHAGVVYVPVNWHFSADELAYVIADSGATVLFTEQQFAATTQAALDLGTTPDLQQVICIDAAKSGFTDFEAFIGGEDEAEPSDQSMGGPMFYTSGTTGRPKGVKSNAGSDAAPPLEVMEMMSSGLSQMLGIPADGTTFICGPVYHSAQWAFSFLPLMAGSTVVMRHKFDAAEALTLIDEHKVTNVHLVPTQFHRFLRLPDTQRAGFSGDSLAVVWHGAAPCPADVKRKMIDWWGPVISEYYGSTEGSIVSMATSQEWLERPGTVGKAAAIVEITVRDDDGAEVAQGESGQIYVRNLMGTDFEYHNEPEKTASVHLEPGVFTFGDIGYFDDAGYLYLSDRKIDMIISGGVNIYPAEIEATLMAHPAVNDAAVFGIPNEEFGEEVKAAVQLRDGFAAGAEMSEALIDHCREHLANYKAPRSVDFESEFPRHETGKLYKRLLRDKYWQNEQRSI